MKTLDEVIKTKELCELNCTDEEHCRECPYAKLDENGEWLFLCDNCEADTLHYLKEYQEHLKWQAYEENCLIEEKKKLKQAYEQGYAKAKHDDAVARSWEESYRQSQMPWNKYTEMGG